MLCINIISMINSRRQYVHTVFKTEKFTHICSADKCSHSQKLVLTSAHIHRHLQCWQVLTLIDTCSADKCSHSQTLTVLASAHSHRHLQCWQVLTLRHFQVLTFSRHLNLWTAMSSSVTVTVMCDATPTYILVRKVCCIVHKITYD